MLFDLVTIVASNYYPLRMVNIPGEKLLGKYIYLRLKKLRLVLSLALSPHYQSLARLDALCVC